MNRKQVNKLKMFKAVYAVLKNYETLWVGIGKFNEMVVAFKANIDVIDQLGVDTASSTTGVTKQKNVLKQNMLSAAFVLAGKGYWYADDIGNEALKSKFKMENSLQQSYGDIEAVEICQAVLDAAIPLLATLADYSVTQPELDALNDLIVDFKTSLDTKTVVKTDYSVDLDALSIAINDNSKIIKDKMTLAMRQFKVIDINFYNAYNLTKRINDAGGGKKRVFDILVPPNEPKLALEHRFSAGNTFTIENYGTVKLRVFLSTTNQSMDSGGFVELMPDEKRVINVVEFICDLDTHRYLVLFNLSGDTNGFCRGKV